MGTGFKLPDCNVNMSEDTKQLLSAIGALNQNLENRVSSSEFKLSKQITTFQNKVNKQVKEVKKQTVSNKRKIDQVDRTTKKWAKEVDENFEILATKVKTIEENMAGDPEEIAALLVHLDVTCERHNRSLGFQPVDPSTCRELSDYLTSIGVDVNINNIIAFSIRNFWLNDMQLTQRTVTWLEDGVEAIWHDGEHSCYVTFQDLDYVKKIFKYCKGFVKNNAQIGRHFRKIRLLIVPQLAEQWSHEDARGYRMRMEWKEMEKERKNNPERQNEKTEYLQTKIMLVKSGEGWRYQLEAKYEEEQLFEPVPLRRGQLLPPVDLRAKELPKHLEDQLTWDD